MARPLTNQLATLAGQVGNTQVVFKLTETKPGPNLGIDANHYFTSLPPVQWWKHLKGENIKW